MIGQRTKRQLDARSASPQHAFPFECGINKKADNGQASLN